MKDTAIYGLSSIVGRFLNYLLVPLHTYRIAAQSGGYGIVSNIYAYTALLLALLTFGMETTLFRFSNKEGENADKVYGTVLRMVGSVVLAFIVISLIFLDPISGALGYATHPEYIACMIIIVGMDAFQAIMFSRLRQQRRPFKFMFLKFAYIIPSVLLNLVIFLVLPALFPTHPELQAWFSGYDSGAGLIFFANLLCTSLVFIGFIPELKGLGYGFDKTLAVRMLKYTWPLLLLSLVGVLNQVADKIIFPFVVPGEEGKVQLGIYGACVKIAMIMSLLTQAFRYAYEPIVFNGSRDSNNPQTLADGMKYFVVFTLLAFLAVMFYMPILRNFVNQDYWDALGVIPIVMAAEVFMGIYFNLSFWYKLSDRTWWGAVISAIGAAVMIVVNIVMIPKIGYWACAWGGFAGYLTSMLLSYFIGRRKFPIPYDMRTMFIFVVIACALYVCSDWFQTLGLPVWLNLIFNTLLIGTYCLYIWRDLIKKEYGKR